jgi:pimeloyl-ACP methyl ester carboxylesterase
MAYAETRDGAHLYIKDWGRGDPVILIHGWPLSADSWDPVSNALVEAGHRVIAYDRRGFGRSDQSAAGYDYDSLADDLADVMQRTGATENVTLVGFSMGGGEVARYMSRHGGKGVVRAVLVASIVPFVKQTDDNPDGVPQSKFDEIEQDIREDRPAFMQAFLQQFYGVGWISKPVSQGVLDAGWHMCMQAGLLPTLQAAKSWSSTDFRPDCGAFNVPTLIIHGTSDKNVPIEPTARMAASLIEDVQLVEYDGEPHGLTETARDRLIGDLLAFLNNEEVGAYEAQERMIDPVLPMGTF